MPYDHPIYREMGDRSLLVELGNKIHIDVSQRVRKLFLTIEKTALKEVVDIIPGYCSLMLVFDPLETNARSIQKKVNVLLSKMDTFHIPEPKEIRIPVVYGGKFGPDLEWVADYHGISPKDVIRLHVETPYHVYMIGFIPGFPYMGELPKALVTPRKETPRTLVPKGSVGLAREQTGIYSTSSPGGWQIIGRTPLSLFDPSNNPPALLEMGDRVRFYRAAEKEINHWQG